MKNININYIAAELGLAKSTVSKALNDRADVGLKTKQLVRDFAKELNYTPNHFAQALNFGKSKLIGVIVRSEMHNEFLSVIARSIMEELQKHDYAAVFASSENSQEKEKKIIQDFTGRFVDGFIIMPSLDTNVKYINGLIDENHKFVVVDNYVKDIKAPFIGTDFEKGSYLATKYLIENGHSKISHLGGPKRVPSTIERIHGYKRAFHDAGVKCPVSMIVNCNYDEKEAEKAFIELRKNNPEMTAVHCASLTMTKGVLEGMKKLEMDIPRDISVVDFGSTSFITSLDQNGCEIGRAAAMTLLNLLDGQQVAAKTIIDPELIPGYSVRPISKNHAQRAGH